MVSELVDELDVRVGGAKVNCGGSRVTQVLNAMLKNMGGWVPLKMSWILEKCEAMLS